MATPSCAHLVAAQTCHEYARFSATPCTGVVVADALHTVSSPRRMPTPFVHDVPIMRSPWPTPALARMASLAPVPFTARTRPRSRPRVLRKRPGPPRPSRTAGTAGTAGANRSSPPHPRERAAEAALSHSTCPQGLGQHCFRNRGHSDLAGACDGRLLLRGSAWIPLPHRSTGRPLPAWPCCTSAVPGLES
jgi:hypothetical protein